MRPVESQSVLKMKVQDVLFPGRRDAVHLRGIRHLIGNGTGTLLYLGLVAALVESEWLEPVPAVVVGFCASVVYTYVLNRWWIHATPVFHRVAVPKYLVVIGISLALNTGLMWLVIDVWHGHYVWALVAATLIVPPTNFLLNYLWVFRR